MQLVSLPCILISIDHCTYFPPATSTHNISCTWPFYMQEMVIGKKQFFFCVFLKLSTAKMHFTFLIFAAYCFMAIFSTMFSKLKKDFISRLALCSKHVQSEFSGCTWKKKPKPTKIKYNKKCLLIEL